MIELMSAVVVALIMGGPAWFGIRRLRRENTDQHNENGKLLGRVIEDVEKIDSKLDRHIEWHLERDSGDV